MRRIFPAYVYGSGPRDGCWWDATCDLPAADPLDADLVCDVAIIGAGFTGLNAARDLAAAGRDVIILDAHGPGWGASGRNGGFCCLGGSKLSNAQIERQVSTAVRAEWRATEKAAVSYVSDLVGAADVDRHSEGETWLAHRVDRMRGVEEEARVLRRDYGVAPVLHDSAELERMGLRAGFHGGYTLPVGFALNPRKYIRLLVGRARDAGARLFAPVIVRDLTEDGSGWRLDTGRFAVRARQVLVATNGYSSETLPGWLAGRYMPVQSTVAVTRPISAAEQAAQGWHSRQMCYDSRNLLHYFRLMPDGRMLFGLRGGLGGTRGSELRARARLERDFRRMFPAWHEVELTHSWSGMVCLSRGLRPFVGSIPGAEGVFGALCYHGNGVAMGSYCGHLIAGLMRGSANDPIPKLISRPLGRFPLGRARRAVMPFAYGAMLLRDL